MQDKTGDGPKPRLWPGRALALTAGGMNALGTGMIFAVMLLVNADILLRYTADAPIRGVAEIVSLSIVGIVFLQLPHTLRTGRMTRAELLIGSLQEKRPRIAALLDALFSLIGLGVFATLAQATWRPLTEAWTRKLYVGSPGDFMLPTWPMYLLIVIGAAMMALQYGAQALQHAGAAARGTKADA